MGIAANAIVNLVAHGHVQRGRLANRPFRRSAPINPIRRRPIYGASFSLHALNSVLRRTVQITICLPIVAAGHVGTAVRN